MKKKVKTLLSKKMKQKEKASPLKSVATTVSSSETNDCFGVCLVLITLLVFTPCMFSKAQPRGILEFKMTGMNITNQSDSNSSTAISVDIQMRDPKSHNYSTTYGTMHIYVVKDRRFIGKASIPSSLDRKEGETMELKARFLVANGNGVGFDYWSSCADSLSDKGIISNFNVWILADGNGLRATCQGVGIAFRKDAGVGIMVDDEKDCRISFQSIYMSNE